MQCGAAALADRRSGQKGLFDDSEEDTPAAAAVDLPDVPEFVEKERLAMEKEVLGYYLANHPLSEHEQTLRTFCSHSSVQLAKVEARSEAIVGGMLSAIKYSHTKSARSEGAPTKYAMWDLEDLDGIVRCILWPEPFAQFGQFVAPDAIVAMRAVVDRRPGGEEVNLIVQEMFPLAELSARFTSGVLIRLREDMHGNGGLEKLREIVRGYPGNKPLKLRLDLADGSSVTLDCPNGRVEINSELRRRVDDLLGPGNFKLVGAAPRATPPPANGRRRAMERN
jgi:DNA polymerase-3 subunit alpha